MCQSTWTFVPIDLLMQQHFFFLTEGGCGDPGTPENGRKVGVVYSINSKVYFDCDLGYELAGSEERKCQRNGTWTGSQPVCRGRPFNGFNRQRMEIREEKFLVCKDDMISECMVLCLHV